MGLTTGQQSALRTLQRFSRECTYAARGSGFLYENRVEEIANAALADGLAAVLSRYCSTTEQLIALIEDAVRRRVQKALRKSESYRLYLATIDEQLGVNPTEILESSDEEPKVEHPTATLLYQRTDTPSRLTIARQDLVVVNRELLDYLRQRPDHMHHLRPRVFEEVVAAIMRNMGYTVELTVQGPDGGIDIIATQKTGLGDLLCIVDCKRYAPNRPVGVQMVRALYGISEAMRATMAILATTSYFTAPAHQFQRTVQNRLTLADYDRLVHLLQQYPGGSKPSRL